MQDVRFKDGEVHKPGSKEEGRPAQHKAGSGAGERQPGPRQNHKQRCGPAFQRIGQGGGNNRAGCNLR